MTKKAFTLIELLVVIAILGLLGAMIIPAIGASREAARRATCANNLRQHGQAWHMYLDEHDEKFPVQGHPPTDTVCLSWGFGGWDIHGYTRPLNRYLDVKNKDTAEIFHCPDDKNPSTADSKTCFDSNLYGNSYYVNPQLLLPLLDHLPLAAITRSQSRVYLGRCNELCDPGHGGHGKDPADVNTPVMVLFVDGHVKGPYNWKSDFDLDGSDDSKPVYEKPN